MDNFYEEKLDKPETPKQKPKLCENYPKHQNTKPASPACYAALRGSWGKKKKARVSHLAIMSVVKLVCGDELLALNALAYEVAWGEGIGVV